MYFKTSQNVTFNYYQLSLTCTTPVVVKDTSDVFFLQYLEGNEMKSNEHVIIARMQYDTSNNHKNEFCLLPDTAF